MTVDSGALGVQEFRVSGIGNLSDGDDTETSFVTTTEGLARFQGGEQQSVNGAFVRLTEEARADGARQRMVALGFVDSMPPSRVATLEQIGSVPRLLAAALIVLGLGGVLHSLLVAGSRRRSDIAIAKAIGFTRRQAASTVRWQGAVTFAFAAAVGLPLGLFVGRLIWKQVASGVGAVDLVSIPWPTLIIVPLVGFAIVLGARFNRRCPSGTCACRSGAQGRVMSRMRAG